MIDVVRRRLLGQRRQAIIADVREAEAEIAEGKSTATTAAEVIREIAS